MLGKKLAIDLGTKNLRAMSRSIDSVVVTPVPGRPLERDRITDAHVLEQLLAGLVHRTAGRQRIFRPDVVVVVPGTLSGTDRRTLLGLLAHVGTRTTYLVDTTLAVALGSAATDARKPICVLSLGAQRMEAAVVDAQANIVAAMRPTGGDDLALAIAAAVKERHRVELGIEHAEAAMLNAATAVARRRRSAQVGVDGSRADVTSDDLAPAVAAHVEQIVGLVRDLFKETPPYLMDEILSTGVVVAGGGALLDGLEEALRSNLGVAITVAPMPELCALRGAAKAADTLDVLKRNYTYIH